MIVAIIPARGGSKRIPKKNVRLFAGKPIIAYSIEAARKTGLFDKIIVSTDSDEIAAVAESYGAEVPFRRPKELADDFTATAPVLVNALEWLDQRDCHVKYFCCIYATAPFVQPGYIRKGFELLAENNAVTAFTVTSFPSPVFRALKINKEGCVSMFWPEHENSRSNDLPEAYHDAGQFYWGYTRKFMQEKRLYAKFSVPVILPRHLVQDIDTPEDWETAERMYQAFQTGGKDE
ncbi:pseudaminic acid cytidylyltransferase [Desulfococcaceae bacterium HSG9]|nr:pseudaminic acid cytidylyltransferase [Desulfococcaceae bacterium HSG9]